MKRTLPNGFKEDFLDSAPAACVFLSVDRKIIWGNKAFQAATGLSLPDMEGKFWNEGWEPQESWIIKAAPVRQEDGKPIGIVEIAVEIPSDIQMFQKQQESEKALSENKRKLRDAMKMTRLGNWFWDVKTGDVEWSEEVYDIFQLNPSEFKPHIDSILSLSPWSEDNERDKELIRKAVEGREKGSYEQRFLRPDGKTGYYFSTFQGIYDDKGDLIAIKGTVQDITERKQAEEALRTREAQLSNAMMIAKLGYWEYDVNADLFTFNDHFYDIFRTTAAESGGYKMSSAEYGRRFIHPDDIAVLRKEIIKAIETTDSHYSRQLEHRIIYADGETGYISVRFFVVKDSQNRTVMTYGANQDITERKRNAEELAKIEEQYLQSQKMESIGRLAGGVAHDFNNMLSVISGFVELAIDKVNPDSPIYDDLQEIRVAADRSANLTRQMLAFARRQTVTLRILDMNEVVSGILKMIGRLIGEDIDLVWLPGTDVWPVKMDPAQIDQILANLCINARDAIKGVGRITINTENVTLDREYCSKHPEIVPGEYVLLSVSDSGCGIDKDIQDKLFEPFFTTKEVGQGTGLGLATVYGIVKQNNGFISVISELGQGTTFKIYIARYVDSQDCIPKEMLPAPATGGVETILLVEDELAILKMTRLVLERQGYTVLTASTPLEAIRKAGDYTGDIHLLVTDVIMPEMNGMDLVENLKILYPSIKYLFISGYTVDVIAHQGIMNEGTYFIQKPFAVRDLVDKVRELLDRH